MWEQSQLGFLPNQGTVCTWDLSTSRWRTLWEWRVPMDLNCWLCHRLWDPTIPLVLNLLLSLVPWTISGVHQEELAASKLVGIYFHNLRNYGPTITVANEAAARGYQQVLYLFGDKIGEVGTSNIFFVLKDPKTGEKEIVTPLIEDLVLPGVTRDTIIVKFILF